MRWQPQHAIIIPHSAIFSWRMLARDFYAPCPSILFKFWPLSNCDQYTDFSPITHGPSDGTLVGYYGRKVIWRARNASKIYLRQRISSLRQTRGTVTVEARPWEPLASHGWGPTSSKLSQLRVRVPPRTAFTVHHDWGADSFSRCTLQFQTRWSSVQNTPRRSHQRLPALINSLTSTDIHNL